MGALVNGVETGFAIALFPEMIRERPLRSSFPSINSGQASPQDDTPFQSL